jgi:hypothetical protein
LLLSFREIENPWWPQRLNQLDGHGARGSGGGLATCGPLVLRALLRVQDTRREPFFTPRSRMCVGAWPRTSPSLHAVGSSLQGVRERS